MNDLLCAAYEIQHMSPTLNSLITTTSLFTCYSTCLRMNSSQLVAALGCLQEILSVQSSGLATGSVANNSQMAPTSFSKAAPAKVSVYIIYFVHVHVTNINSPSLLVSENRQIWVFGLSSKACQCCMRNCICNFSLKPLLHYGNIFTTFEFLDSTTFALRVLCLPLPS